MLSLSLDRCKRRLIARLRNLFSPHYFIKRRLTLNRISRGLYPTVFCGLHKQTLKQSRPELQLLQFLLALRSSVMVVWRATIASTEEQQI